MKQVNKSEVRIAHEEASAESKIESPYNDKNTGQFRNRTTGFLLLLVLFGTYWVYGWAGEITLVDLATQPSNWTSQVLYGKMIVLSAVFTVIGFGLLLAYFKNMGAVALLVSLFVVSFTVITSPLVSKFWFNVLISDFKGMTFTNTDPYRFLLKSFGGYNIYIDLYNLKVAFANSISQLVMLLGVFGKLSMTQVFLNSILYSIAWNLCHFLSALLVINGPDTRIFDDYQISNVYLFAGCYSLIVALILPPRTRKALPHDQKSIILALAGTFFVFLSFCVTSTLFPLKFTPGQNEFARSYIWQEGFISVFFALSGSVIFSCAGSALFGGRIGVRECVFGTITGGIAYGAVAGTSVNVGAAIASGLFAGLISSLFYGFIHKKMNTNRLLDSYGATNILLVSFFGTFAIAPSVLIAYYNRYWVLTTLQVSNLDNIGLPLVNSNIVGWILTYVGISMGIGLVAGLIVGLVLRLFSSDVRAHHQEFFTMHYGLTPNNSEIFEEELPITTKFERTIKVLKSRKIEKTTILSVIETTDLKREGGKLVRNKREVVDVELHNEMGQAEIDGIGAELKALNITAHVYRGEGSIISGNDTANKQDSRKFKTIYYLLKSRKLDQVLESSSVTNLKAETRERSVGGTVERHAAINGTFDRQDEGVDYLNFLKSKYDGLQLQTSIKS